MEASEERGLVLDFFGGDYLFFFLFSFSFLSCRERFWVTGLSIDSIEGPSWR